MSEKLISADSHIDLSWLPPDLFTGNAHSSLKDRMPYVADSEDGRYWEIEGGWQHGTGQRILWECGVGAIGMKYRPGVSHRADRFADEGIFTDGQNGVRRLTDPELRARDQDRDGIAAEVLHGLTGIERWVKDLEVVGEIYRIYNEWLADFCKAAPTRFHGLACICSRDIGIAVKEAERARKLGLKGLLLYAVPGRDDQAVPFWHDSWEPFWAIAAEQGLPIHFHTTGGQYKFPPKEEGLLNHHRARAVIWSNFQISAAEQLAAIIFSGALERYPNLRIVLGEFGAGWIPYLLERMDEVWENRHFRESCELPHSPTEYWRRQGRAVIMDEPLAGTLLQHLGEDNLMFGNDFPHGDGVWPESRGVFDNLFGGLPTDVREKIAWRNAELLYGSS